MKNDKRMAIFIDCENMSAKYIEDIFLELAKHGQVMIRQAYKDWGTKEHKSWREVLPKHAIKAIQTSRNSKYKNVSDFQIVIDVMNTVHDNIVDTIVLVSSDSDYTSLAIEIKSKGFEVIGFGEEKTPNAFINSLSTFYKLKLEKESEKEKQNINTRENVDEVVLFLRDAILNSQGDEDYALVSQIGTYLKNKDASLNAKNYGVNSWGDILKLYPEYFTVSNIGQRNSIMIVSLNISYS